MSRSAPQLNIRSARARERAQALARRTGLTTTQVVEQALDAFEPSAAPEGDEALPPGMIRKGALLVFTGGPTITNEQVIASINADREERAEAVANPVG